MVPLIHSLSPITNVLAIDLPSHGSLWPGFCTFGVEESEQVLEAVRWGEQSGFHRIMLAGHSMGGSSSLLALTREPHDSVDGIATIGSYSSIESVFRSVASNLHLPQAPVTWILETASRIADYDYRRAAPLEHMNQLKVPYLAIHGNRDALVPPQEAERLVSAASGTSSLIWYDGGHDEPENPAIAEALVRFLRVLDDEISKPTFH
jgi:dipeptidyl aminopeptidase/acylaminoacyl peptidase